jgi:VWFA-related protein
MADLRVARALVMLAIFGAMGSAAPARGRALPVAPVTWLIFVDDLHIDFRDTGYARTLLTSIATELVREGDAFALRSSGPSGVSIPLTSDRTQFDAAIHKVAGAELNPAEVSGPEGESELQYRAKVAGTAAADMLKMLPTTMGGRAALLYISDGYSRTPVDPAITGLPRTARQLAVTVFALNPHGLRRVPQSAASGARPVSEHDRDVMLKSLREIAEPTGGLAVLEEADFADALQRIGHVMR